MIVDLHIHSKDGSDGRWTLDETSGVIATLPPDGHEDQAARQGVVLELEARKERPERALRL